MMASRDDIVIEITPQVLLKAYTCGIFPMAESADDPALYWIEPQHRGILPLDNVHVPRRLARTLRTTHLRGPHRHRHRRRDRGLRRLAPGAPLDLDQRAHPRALPRPVRPRALPHRRGVGAASVSSAGSTASRSTAPSSARACSPTSATPPRSRSCYLAARLAHGGFRLLDTQFVTDHLRQFGTVELNREEFHRLLEKALDVEADFHALPARCLARPDPGDPRSRARPALRTRRFAPCNAREQRATLPPALFIDLEAADLHLGPHSKPDAPPCGASPPLGQETTDEPRF